MANTVSAPFDNYKIFYWSQHSPQLRAAIYCYQGVKYVGRMVFVDDAQPLPANTGNTQPNLNYHLRQFNDLMTLVREEKPLSLFLNLDNGIGIVSTDENEPTGEDEGP
jgi:hypothetical protein